MKISYNWLKEFIDIKVVPEKLADDLSMFGHEVESISKKNDDYILDFEITPNRGDCLSISGMAREVSALYGLKLNNAIGELPKETEIDKKIKLKIEDKKVCPRYSYTIIDNIEIMESPKWLREKLEVMGLRSINNIVDITNYITLELGQPMHAYDLDKISGGVYSIRLSKKGESLITLDGKDRELSDNDVVISDEKNIFDLAGIMGGASSEIGKNTKTIVLEAAIFDPILIRKTSKKLRLQTDASYRYERSVDKFGTIFALQRAMSIIYKICQSAKFGKIMDIKSDLKTNTIDINIDKINNLIGSKFNEKEIAALLSKLNFKYSKNQVEVPSYRSHDVTIWQDIAEEIARIYGYNKLGVSAITKNPVACSNNYDKKENIKDILVENGFTEIFSYSFSDKKLLEKLGFKLENLRKVINGLTPETEYLRPSLVPSLLTTFQKNPWAPEIKIFELGKVFINNKEEWQLGIATSSKKSLEMSEVLKDLNINIDISTPSQEILDYLKIRKKVSYVTIDVNNIQIDKPKYKKNLKSISYKKISEFPPTIRDFSFIIDKNIDNDDVINEISSCGKSILFTELFDEFISDKLGVNKKSIALHVWLQDLSSEMKEEMVNEISKKIVDKIEKIYNAKLRG